MFVPHRNLQLVAYPNPVKVGRYVWPRWSLESSFAAAAPLRGSDDCGGAADWAPREFVADKPATARNVAIAIPRRRKLNNCTLLRKVEEHGTYHTNSPSIPVFLGFESEMAQYPERTWKPTSGIEKKTFTRAGLSAALPERLKFPAFVSCDLPRHDAARQIPTARTNTKKPKP